MFDIKFNELKTKKDELFSSFYSGRSMSLGGFGLFDQRRVLNRLLFAANESMPLLNPVNYTSPDLFRYKTSNIFVCIPSSGYERFFRTYIPIFDILLVAVIPFFLLCFTNIGIIIFTMRNNQRMRQQHRKRTHRRHQRLTIMLLSVTLAFIGLTCPSVIFICVNKIIYSGQILAGEKGITIKRANVGQPTYIQIFVEICEALWYTKHAMNFILYTLSGQDFRREFIKLFPRCLSRRSFFLRKLLNKTQQTTTVLDETTIDTHIRIIDSRTKLLQKKTITKSASLPPILLANGDG